MELLAERATEGLDAERSAELQRLLERHPEFADDTLELAAAAIDRALSGPADPMPDPLRARLMATAAGFSASRDSSRSTHGSHGGLAADPSEATSPERGGGSDRPGQPRLVAATSEREPEDTARELDDLRRGPRIAAWGGWLATAAALVLAALAWWPNRSSETPSPAEPPPAVETADAVSPAAARERLLTEAQDVVRLDWSATEDPAATGAGGDVVWSPSRQSGFMRIRGLETNDPTSEQYQLWVFDAARDERYPVDGGVFDIPAGADEVVVPIDTRLPVDTATLFAVTVEPPGGVVVSDRERIVLVAGGG